jgi:SPP1 family predicted phage head-tail adaptor
MPSNPYLQRSNPLVINPGELRHSVTIEAPDNSSPSSRGMSIAPGSWTVVRSARAAIYTAGGRETSMASQVVSDVSHVVKVRWTSTPIKAGYRVLFSGQFVTVQYVENVLERNRVLLLYCNKVDGGR